MTIPEHALMPVTNRPPIVFARGEGSYLWDTEGKKYLDFIQGWAVNCLGHCHPALQEALHGQIDSLINNSPAFYNQPMLDFAELLTSKCELDHVFFCSTGAEANEGAIKLARKFGKVNLNGAFEIVTTLNSFHGRTLATMAATGKEAWDDFFPPKVEGFVRVPFNDLEAVIEAITDKTCAVMLELVQGEGGVNVASDDYVKGLRKLCDEKGILLIADEVQTGIGRTGKLCAHQHYDIVPDIMTLGKGLGGGFPVAAQLCRKECSLFEPGEQGGTYSSQPLGMAAGLAVLKEVADSGLLEQVAESSEYIVQGLHERREALGIENIRGKGLLIAFDFVDQDAGPVASKCLENGLLVNAPKPKSIRLMPALNVSHEEIDEMFSILEQTCAAR